MSRSYYSENGQQQRQYPPSNAYDRSTCSHNAPKRYSTSDGRSYGDEYSERRGRTRTRYSPGRDSVPEYGSRTGRSTMSTASAQQPNWTRQSSGYDQRALQLYRPKTDAGSVSPQDSVSQAASRRSMAWAKPTNSQSSRDRYDSAYASSAGSTATMSDYGEDQQPYYDEANEVWVRDIAPSWTRK